MEKDDEKFFYEDEVAMVSPESGLVKYGLVLTTNRSRSEIELKKNSYKSPNEIKVIWHPSGTEEIIPDDKVVLMDRSLMPGDVVSKITEGKPSQFGYCENIDISATVKILNTNKIIENISAQYFTHTKPFSIDSSIFYESWVGGVYDVKYKITFTSQDGSIFTLEDPYRQDFISLSTSDNFSIDDNLFYHGQKLKMCLDSLENAKFITTSSLMNCLWHNYKKKYNYKFGTKWIKVYVQDVAVSSVEVEWYCQTSSKTTLDDHWPERIITGDNLKKLKTIDLFESCSIQVADTHWYKIKDTDNLITMKQWRKKCTDTFNTESIMLSNKNKKNRRNTKFLGSKKPKCTNSTELNSFDNSHHNPIVLVQRADIITTRDISKLALQSKKSEFKPSTSTTGNSSLHTLKSNRLKRNRMRSLLVKKSKHFSVPKVSTKPNSKVVVEVIYTKSAVDVIWQDGTREKGLSSIDLYPVHTLDDLEFFPGDFVTQKNSPPDVYGVIESVDHTGRTAHIQWFNVLPENPSLPHTIEKTDFSVYDLRDHPDFQFKSGCLIIHVSPDTNPDLSTFTAGQVLNAGPNGKVLVMWVNGERTECWPQELFVVKLHEEDNFSYQDDYDDEDDEDAPLAVNDDLSEDWMSVTSPGSSNRSQDQEDPENTPNLFYQSITTVTGGIKSLLDAVGHNRDINIKLSEKVITLQKAMEQIRGGFNICTSLPSETKDIETYKDLKENTSKLIEKVISKPDSGEDIAEIQPHETLFEDSKKKLKKVASDVLDRVNRVFKEINNLNDDIEKMDVTESPVTLTLNDHLFKSLKTVIEPEYQVIAKPEEAGVFDMVETLLDGTHQFFNDKENLNPTMLKVITKDIQILQKSLPAGIWVKSFENRMDLFSIMIRGPEKTPYAGGLFMFDVKIPHTYPAQPPLCHYYSFCDERLNPNLYEDGKVCLSLLGTWSGYGVELWSPKESNLLQLIVSIQGLILVSEPYYNEAGFDSQRGQLLAKENSRVYNEMVLIKVVQSMTNLLTMNFSKAKTAVYFQDEIMEHLKIHGLKLINTIENWIKMSERELTEDEKLSPGYPLLPLSKGCCLSIQKALNDYKEILNSINIVFTLLEKLN